MFIRLSVLCGEVGGGGGGGGTKQTNKTKQNPQTHQPILFNCHGTIDSRFFIPLSVTLVVTGDHKVSTKQNLSASFSWIFFSWSRQHLVWRKSDQNRTVCFYFWVRSVELKEIADVLLSIKKTINKQTKTNQTNSSSNNNKTNKQTNKP